MVVAVGLDILERQVDVLELVDLGLGRWVAVAGRALVRRDRQRGERGDRGDLRHHVHREDVVVRAGLYRPALRAAAAAVLLVGRRRRRAGNRAAAAAAPRAGAGGAGARAAASIAAPDAAVPAAQICRRASSSVGRVLGAEIAAVANPPVLTGQVAAGLRAGGRRLYRTHARSTSSRPCRAATTTAALLPLLLLLRRCRCRCRWHCYSGELPSSCRCSNRRAGARSRLAARAAALSAAARAVRHLTSASPVADRVGGTVRVDCRCRWPRPGKLPEIGARGIRKPTGIRAGAMGGRAPAAENDSRTSFR